VKARSARVSNSPENAGGGASGCPATTSTRSYAGSAGKVQPTRDGKPSDSYQGGEPGDARSSPTGTIRRLAPLDSCDNVFAGLPVPERAENQGPPNVQTALLSLSAHSRLPRAPAFYRSRGWIRWAAVEILARDPERAFRLNTGLCHRPRAPRLAGQAFFLELSVISDAVSSRPCRGSADQASWT
jgi:hypothetical protein